MRRIWQPLVIAAVLGWLGACGPTGDPLPTTADLAIEVTTPEGASEAWGLLFRDDLQRAVNLTVDAATRTATGTAIGLPPGSWQLLALSASDTAEDVGPAFVAANVTLAAGDEGTFTGDMSALATVYYDLTFNPTGPVFAGSGKLNPFAVPRIREAMNQLVDREVIADLITLADAPGQPTLALPLFTASLITTSDFRDLLDAFEDVARAYAFDAAAAGQVIADEMTALGAVRVDGVWHHDGEPVTITLLIRNEDQRVAIGDDVADRLEGLGFVTVRQRGTAAELNPLWFTGDPNLGTWHVYTGAWMSTTTGQPSDTNYRYFYTPDGLTFGDGLTSPLFDAYTPTAAFYDVATRLAEGDFADEAERRSLLRQAITLSLEDSVRIFLAQTFRPAVDLGGAR